MNWEQLKTIIWLRWRLTRNQFLRAGQLNAVISILLVTIMAILSVSLAIGCIVGGWFAGAKASPAVLLLIWDGVILIFLIIWLSGLMVEIQRSESIDLARLLHLPVTLRQVFVFNYAASHFTPSIIMLLPGMLGLCLGLTLSGGKALALLVPLVLAFLFAVTAWTYCLRGWLAALMTSKRRRRTVVVWMTLAIVLICQTPNLIFNSRFFRRQSGTQTPATNSMGNDSARPKRSFALPEPFVEGHLFVPPGWIGYGAMTLKDGTVLPATAAIAASFLIGLYGVMRSYRMTVRFYQGAENTAEFKPQPASVRSSREKRLLVERNLPWLPEEVTALTLATFRSSLRTPELKMALVMPVVLASIFLVALVSRPKNAVPETLAAFAGAAAIAVSAFSLAPTMSNVFGVDRNGFRALVLLPTRRDRILLAKNLAFFPFAAFVAVTFLVLAKWLLRTSWTPFLTGLLQLPTAYLLLSLMCNLVSILAPYRLKPGTLQAKKPKPIIFVAVFAVMLFLPLLSLPILIPPALQLLFSYLKFLPWLPVNLLAAMVLLVGIAFLYWAVLPSQGRLLQRREQRILTEVTEEVE